MKRPSSNRTNADHHLWENLMQEIKPLVGRDQKAPPEPVSPHHLPIQKNSAFPGVERIKGSLPSLQHGRQQGITPGIDSSTLAKFRAGKMPIEGILDLHGMTQVFAHETLVRWLLRGYEHGKRCLLIVTGKGQRPPSWDEDDFNKNSTFSSSSRAGKIGHYNAGEKHAPRGVLKQSLPLWLDSSPLRQIILAIATAKLQHGGDGALYVLLKRKRQD